MAGSFRHLVGEDGGFTMDLIENLGDANEALEECYDMILWLAKVVLARDSDYNDPNEVIADAWAWGYLADRRPDLDTGRLKDMASDYWDDEHGRPGQT